MSSKGTSMQVLIFQDLPYVDILRLFDTFNDRRAHGIRLGITWS